MCSKAGVHVVEAAACHIHVGIIDGVVAVSTVIQPCQPRNLAAYSDFSICVDCVVPYVAARVSGTTPILDE